MLTMKFLTMSFLLFQFRLVCFFCGYCPALPCKKMDKFSLVNSFFWTTQNVHGEKDSSFCSLSELTRWVLCIANVSHLCNSLSPLWTSASPRFMGWISLSSLTYRPSLGSRPDFWGAISTWDRYWWFLILQSLTEWDCSKFLFYFEEANSFQSSRIKRGKHMSKPFSWESTSGF